MKFTIEMSGNELKTAMENGSLKNFIDVHVEEAPENNELAKKAVAAPVRKKEVKENLQEETTQVQDTQEETQSSQDTPKDTVETELTLEDVRPTLADLARSGKGPEVQALITSFDAEKLSDIDPSKYDELMKKAQEL